MFLLITVIHKNINYFIQKILDVELSVNQT
jgi:hypothetical protein